MDIKDVKILYYGVQETFLAQIVEDNGFEFVVKNVVRLMEAPSQDGQTGNLVMLPFLPYGRVDKEMPFHKGRLITTIDPSQAVFNHYKKQFSKVMLPDQPHIEV